MSGSTAKSGINKIHYEVSIQTFKSTTNKMNGIAHAKAAKLPLSLNLATWVMGCVSTRVCTEHIA